MPSCPTGVDVEHAAALLKSGRLVAIPTETVYGLGGDALNPLAVARIFEAKERPHFDPLIVHIPDLSWIDRIAARVPRAAREVAERFWPGPLTLILPKTDAVPDLVTSGLPTVAVRIPSHPMALDVIRRAGTPIAAPSANPFGRISPTTAAHVADQLGEKIDYILDGGPCRIGLESTVLDVSDDAPPALLRPGGLPLEDLEALLGPIATRTESDDDTAAPAPGMLTRHYAPRTPLRIISSSPLPPFGRGGQGGSGEALKREPTPRDERIGLLTLTPPNDATHYAAIEVLSPSADLREAATHFFAALRRLDSAGLDHIEATPFPDHGLGRALNDRLRRAAQK